MFRQWLVLWFGAAWLVVSLLLAEDTLLRWLLADGVVTGLLYWQLTPSKTNTDALLLGQVVVQAESISTTQPSKQGPVGIGGWLAFVVISLGIVAPFVYLGQMLTLSESAASLWGYTGGVVELIARASGSVFVSLALLRKWPTAPRLAIALFAALGLLSAIDLLVATETRSLELVGQVVGVLLGNVAWILYFRKSRRVRNTFAVASDAPVAPKAAVFWGTCLAAALMVSLGVAFYSRGQTRIDKQYAAITPDEWFRAFNDKSFAPDFAKAYVERESGALPPDSSAWVDGSPEIEDLKSAVKLMFRYRADVGLKGGDIAKFVGEVRMFAHPSGIVSLSATCNASLIQCEGLSALMTRAETELVPRLSGTQLSGILPEGGVCSSDSSVTAGAGEPRSAISCDYGDGGAASLTLFRSNLAQARTDMQAGITATPRFRREAVRRVNSLSP